MPSLLPSVHDDRIDPDALGRPDANGGTVKADLHALVDALPDECSFEDALRELAFHRMVERGLLDVEEGDTLPHAELKDRATAWSDGR